MTRPVDKPSSTDVEKAVAFVDKEAARRGAAARKTYAAGVKIAKSEYDARLRELRSAEREELKSAERWRIGAVAKIEGRPSPLSDYRSVKREDVVRVANGVSLPRLPCLERRS